MNEICQARIHRITQGFQECQKALVAIGDETRQLIILVLLESELSGIRVGEIAQKTHLTRPSVSHHLQILKEAGIIDMRKQGTKNYYFIQNDGTKWNALLDLVEQIHAGVQQLHVTTYDDEK